MAGFVNELVRNLDVEEDDRRPHDVQGLVDIPVDAVRRKRKIILTDKPYPMLSYRERPIPGHFVRLTDLEQEEDTFHTGPLVCRWTRVRTLSLNRKCYEESIRQTRRKEAKQTFSSTESRTKQPLVEPEELQNGSMTTQKTGSRPTSLECLVAAPPRRPNPPCKKPRYTFADVFCGAGGASRGADNAGLQLVWALDKDEHAIQAYRRNFKGPKALHRDAHSFPKDEIERKDSMVDFIHFSNPCQPFSANQ
jgi:DNA (cytosine-5)-methyltransferase 1